MVLWQANFVICRDGASPCGTLGMAGLKAEADGQGAVAVLGFALDMPEAGQVSTVCVGMDRAVHNRWTHVHSVLLLVSVSQAC